MYKRSVVGIAFVAALLVVFVVGCIDCCDRCLTGEDRRADNETSRGVVDSFVMYGYGNSWTPRQAYSYMLRNYSDLDVRVGLNDSIDIFDVVRIIDPADTSGVPDTVSIIDTTGVVIPGRSGGEFSSYSFKSSHDSVAIWYRPANRVYFEIEGLMFVRFFNR